ncbi:hypothetical protein [Mycolicibacter minnesotensis]
MAALAVVGIVSSMVLDAGGGLREAPASRSAGDVAKAYLEALARGDADTALSLGLAEPASRKFLTDESLKQQIEHWPITNIEVLSDTSKFHTGEVALVKIRADFGGTRSTGEIFAKRRGGTWKLPSAAVNLQIVTMGDDATANSLTILGKPLGADRHLYVFPGFLSVKSVPYVDVQLDSAITEPVPADDIPRVVTPTYELNHAGRNAIRTALGTWLIGCLRDPGSFYQCRSPQVDPPIDPASVKITGPVDLGDTTQRLGAGSLKATVEGQVRFSFTANLLRGGQGTFDSVQKVSASMAVDLAKQPPVVGPAH